MKAERREPRDLGQGVMLDYDDAGNRIDIDNARTKVELGTLVISKVPARVETIPG